MRAIGKLFAQGLIAILPVAVTLYILYWLAVSAESLLGGLIKLFLPERLYVPGMGVAAGFVVVLGIGVLLRLWLFRKIFGWGEKLLERLPVIKTVYGSVRDLMSFFDASKKKEFDKVVMVTLVEKDVRLVGLVTREDLRELPDGIGDDESVAVYLPMSYQMGGFTVFLPKANIRPVDMSIEEAMRFALTAAVSTKTKERANRQQSR
jgi:uncharacterized membrane protein